MTGIGGVFGRNAILNINDCRGFLNRSETNYDRRQRIDTALTISDRHWTPRLAYSECGCCPDHSLPATSWPALPAIVGPLSTK